MSKATLTKDTAGRDEYCSHCGYPFDPGDWLWRSADGAPYCCKGCGQDSAEKAKANHGPQPIPMTQRHASWWGGNGECRDGLD